MTNCSGAETVKRNSSISRLYIFYQMFTVGSSILGPASVTLMIAGRFRSSLLLYKPFLLRVCLMSAVGLTFLFFYHCVQVSLISTYLFPLIIIVESVTELTRSNSSKPTLPCRSVLIIFVSLCVFQPGAFQFVFKLTGELSIVIASIPPVFYIIVCFVAKSNNQITIAAIMSVLYAFLMTASFFSIIGG